MPNSDRVNGEIKLDARGPFPLTVDWSKSCNELILSGNYDHIGRQLVYAGSSIDSFDDGREAVIVSYSLRSTTAEILRALSRANLRPGVFRQLLALGIDFPELQREFPIVALGHNNLIGAHPVACLDSNRDKRSIDLVNAGRGWSTSYRFLAFPK